MNFPLCNHFQISSRDYIYSEVSGFLIRFVKVGSPVINLIMFAGEPPSKFLYIPLTLAKAFSRMAGHREFST